MMALGQFPNKFPLTRSQFFMLSHGRPRINRHLTMQNSSPQGSSNNLFAVTLAFFFFKKNLFQIKWYDKTVKHPFPKKI